MINGFHIEPTNICTLKCSGCARTRFINQWPQHWKNYSLDIKQTMNFLDIDLTGKNIHLSGVYGDPIYHPDFINFVQQFKDRGAILSITTNGSYKKEEWWKELSNILTAEDLLIFSIDGVPENFTQYRVNADWNSIKQGIDIVVKSPVKTEWKYIPFLYNENSIDAARRLSSDLGINEFNVSASDRFDETTEYLKPINLLGPKYQSKASWKNNQHIDIAPKCQNNREHYISAAGYYSPCCFMADHRFYYKTQFGKNKKDYNIQDQTLTQILSQSEVIHFYQNLPSQPGCQYNCPSS